jgi:hypothetical protein
MTAFAMSSRFAASNFSGRVWYPSIKTAFAVLLWLLLAPPELYAELPTSAQRKCLATLSDAESTVAKLAGADVSRCVSMVSKGRKPGSSVAQCLAAESPALRKARARNVKAAAKACGSVASFGPNSVGTVNQALAGIVDASRLFGADLAATLQSPASNVQAAKCQLTLTQQLNKVAQAELREYKLCTGGLLKQGKATGAEHLQACVGADTGGWLKAKNAAAAQIASACTGVASTAYPGACSGASAAAELAQCVAAEAHCGTCSALNTADRFAAACHQYENGVAIHYCGTKPQTSLSVARQWNDEILSAIRIDNPRPPVHARNLFHLSAAMYDAWAAYDDKTTSSDDNARAYLTAEQPQSTDVAGDRDIAVSFAAFRVLAQRYSSKLSLGAAASQIHFRQRMNLLGLDPGYTDTSGDTPAALGNRVAQAVLAYGLSDGSNEYKNYLDPTYEPVNQPLIVKEPAFNLTDPRCAQNEPECDPNYNFDPNRWQPLALDKIFSQNGIPLPEKTQTAISSHWGDVIPFAMYRVPQGQLYHALDPPPLMGGATQSQLIDQVMEVIRLTSQLGATDTTTMDISPAALGNNDLGANNGTGHTVNPVTGNPYESNVVLRADYGRVLAEFWADGPTSETPPGHWNLIANHVADTEGFVRKLGGVGPVLSPLEWDVKVYFALNGAAHDAAIAAWGTKRVFDSVRPISIIRYLAKQHLLPLVPGLVEEITQESAASGGKHAHLVTAEAGGHVGDIAIWTWPGSPADPKTQVAGIKWVLGTAWVPYQRNTFVTPAFPGYISGHSTYSRAAAEVLTLITGSAFFPGGMMEYVIPKGSLIHEDGPTVDVRLQWARYYDAADQSGRSRLWGGIHIEADDFGGRRVGSLVGQDAYNRAVKYFNGETAP